MEPAAWKVRLMRQRLQQKSMCRSMAERASSGSPRPMAEQMATCWEPMTIRLSFFRSVATNSQDRMDR